MATRITRLLSDSIIVLVTVGGILGCDRKVEDRSADKERSVEIRNVMLISIDTCRADYLSCYGFERSTTPNIDQLARNGVLFARAQSTNPITLPAHCSMLTGTTPPFHNVHLNLDHLDDARNTTLAEILQENGYRTAAFIGAFPLDARFGLRQGFDEYDSEFGEDGRRGITNQRTAGQVSRSAVSWLDQHGDQPFFLFLHYFDPHKPYEPPEPFSSTFTTNRYAGEIAYADFCIGQLIRKLDELGQRDSTLIIVTSDHGESLGEHDEETHAYFAYQSTLRVPLIFVGPGCAMGHKVDGAVSLIDIVPTVLNLLELPVPSQVQGTDLSDSLRGRPAPTKNRYLYSESWYPAKFGCCPLRGIVHDKWHYILSVKPELYDLNQDPHETENLVEQETEVARRLQDRLKELLARPAANRDDSVSTTTDPDTAKRLQALGYVGGRPETATVDIDPTMEDPKDFISVFREYSAAQDAWVNKQLGDAEAHCLEILARRPDMLHIRFLLGHIASERGRQADAVMHYSNVLTIATAAKNAGALNYEIYQAYNNLAWILATTNDSALGDGARAVEYARRANALSGGGNAEILDTLAVAYAATGEFKQAIATAEQALTLSGDDATSAMAINKRLELFKQDLPFRQAPP